MSLKLAIVDCAAQNLNIVQLQTTKCISYTEKSQDKALSIVFASSERFILLSTPTSVSQVTGCLPPPLIHFCRTLKLILGAFL